jgi:serine/threonine protein kinase
MHDNLIFTVIEFSNGNSGRKFVRDLEGGLTREHIKGFSGLARACHSMGQAGVFHRDLTLDNILVFTS